MDKQTGLALPQFAFWWETQGLYNRREKRGQREVELQKNAKRREARRKG
jgi:hypothetical protein